MARGKESDAHHIMFEALEFRLRKLFPESKVTLGKKIQPVGLKPDIYIEHPDGRKWVYEVVYGNGNAQHILDNHQRFRAAGIHDFWILWDTLGPRTEPLPTDQGVLEQLVVAKKRTKATRLLQALATIHAEYTTTGNTVLYAFALDGLNGLIEKPHRAMQVISTGITVYQIEKFAVSSKYLEYVSDYVTLMELDFDEDGYIKISDENTDEILQESLLRSLGFEDQARNFPLKFLNNLNQMLLNLPANVPENVTKVYAEKILMDATPEETLELQEFISSGGAAKLGTLIRPPALPADASASLESSEGIQAVAEFLDNFRQAMEDADIPVLLRKTLMLALDPPKWTEIADVMRWRENSEAVQRIQNDEH